MKHKTWFIGAVLFLAIALAGCASGAEQAGTESEGAPIGVVYRTPS